jgi:hypothetical protein
VCGRSGASKLSQSLVDLVGSGQCPTVLSGLPCPFDCRSPERLRQRPQHRPLGVFEQRSGLSWKQHDPQHERHRPAYDRVDGTLGPGAVSVQCGDQDRRGGSLVGKHHPFTHKPGATQNRRVHRHEHDQRKRRSAGSDGRRQDVADRDSEEHSADHLHGSPAAPDPAGAEGDRGRYGREERLLVAEDPVRDQPGDRGGDRCQEDRLPR